MDDVWTPGSRVGGPGGRSPSVKKLLFAASVRGIMNVQNLAQSIELRDFHQILYESSILDHFLLSYHWEIVFWILTWRDVSICGIRKIRPNGNLPIRIILVPGHSGDLLFFGGVDGGWGVVW